MPRSAPAQKAGPKAKPSLRPLLSSTVPIKLLSLDAVFQEFVTVGKVLPDEKGKFCGYLSDLTPFLEKEVLRLMTSRLAPFSHGEVNALESDALKLEGSLNSYLANTAKSDFRSKTWYERYQTRIKLAVELLTPPPKPPAEDSQ
jgi:hypothetical protein